MSIENEEIKEENEQESPEATGTEPVESGEVSSSEPTPEVGEATGTEGAGNESVPSTPSEGGTVGEN